MKDIYILGVGYNTPVIIELAELCGYNVRGLYHYKDGRNGENVNNIPILGTYKSLFNKKSLENMNFALSMGDNEKRIDLSNAIINKKGNIPTLIHPTASVSKFAIIEDGVFNPSKLNHSSRCIYKKKYSYIFYVGISHNVKN